MVAPFGAQPCPTIDVTLPVAARIDEHQGFAAEAVEVLFDHAADEQRRNAGIEGVAAPRQHFEGGRGRERMAGRDAGIAAHHRRPLGGQSVKSLKATSPREARRSTNRAVSSRA